MPRRVLLFLFLGSCSLPATMRLRCVADMSAGGTPDLIMQDDITGATYYTVNDSAKLTYTDANVTSLGWSPNSGTASNGVSVMVNAGAGCS